MAKLRPHKSLLFLIIIGISAALLIWLGILQYHWLGQISETDHERRRAALRLAASRFSDDFDRELARAFVTFQLDSESLRRQKWEDFSARYDFWMSQSPFPQLVSEIYLLSGEENDRSQVARYDHGSRRFESIETPADLRRRIDLRQNVIGFGDNVILPPFNTVDGNLPALFIPLLQSHNTPHNRDRHMVLKMEGVGTAFNNYVVVRLNQDLIQREIIPLLARRHFSDPPGQEEMDYDLSVTSRRSPQIHIYPSAQGAFNERPQTSDVTVGLFGLRPDLIAIFTSGARSAGNLESIRPISFVAPVSIPRREAPAAGAIYSYHGRVNSASGGTVAGTAISGTSFSSNGDLSEWSLSLRHRAGSLETAVAQLQRRNLLVGFGILLLLAVNMALIIIASQRERRLARQQVEFVAGVSHELRSPVSAVCLASANLADGLVHDHARVRDYGVMINREGRRLAAAVEQALDFAETEFIRKPYHFLLLAAAEPIERALSAIRSQAAEKGIEIEKEIKIQSALVMADADAVERAVSNLLSNAVKYSGPSRRLKLILQSDGEEIQIAVEDYGIGIDASDISHIFKPFYRGRSAVKANIHGNGLGLFLVDRIIKAHGGRVSVKSAVGQGSRFTIHLPAITDNSEAVQTDSRGEHEQASVAG